MNGLRSLQNAWNAYWPACLSWSCSCLVNKYAFNVSFLSKACCCWHQAIAWTNINSMKSGYFSYQCCGCEPLLINHSRWVLCYFVFHFYLWAAQEIYVYSEDDFPFLFCICMPVMSVPVYCTSLILIWSTPFCQYNVISLNLYIMGLCYSSGRTSEFTQTPPLLSIMYVPWN